MRSITLEIGRAARLPLATLLCALLTSPLAGQVRPPASPLAAKKFEHPDLSIAHAALPVDRLPATAAAAARQALAALGVAEQNARLDPRGGRFATLLLSHPLIPGSGRENALTWAALGVAEPSEATDLEQAVWRLLRQYLLDHRQELSIDVDELGSPAISINDDGALIQIRVERIYQGFAVRDSFLTAVVNHGNLVLLGATNWGNLNLQIRPRVSSDAALARLAAHLSPFSLTPGC